MVKKQISFRLDEITCERLAALAAATDQSQADVLEKGVSLAAELQAVVGQADEEQRTAYILERYAGQLKGRIRRYAGR